MSLGTFSLQENGIISSQEMTEPHIVDAVKYIAAKLRWAHISVIPPDARANIFFAYYFLIVT